MVAPRHRDLYSRRDSYRAIASEAWSIQVWKGVPGRLSYALAILPNSGEGSLASIARGDQDWVWRAVAHNLKAAGRGNSVVRIAWEANLSDWRWGATRASAPAFRAAFRRVAQTMKTTAPDLVIDFGVGCGPGLPGSKVRTAPLTISTQVTTWSTSSTATCTTGGRRGYAVATRRH